MLADDKRRVKAANMLHARDSMADNNGHIFCRCGDVYHPSKVGPKSSGQEDSRGELFFACPKRKCGFFIWKREFDEWLRGGTTPRYFSSPTGSSTPKNDLESLERSIGSLERSIGNLNVSYQREAIKNESLSKENSELRQLLGAVLEAKPKKRKGFSRFIKW